jgi:hypothetical protein
MFTYGGKLDAGLYCTFGAYCLGPWFCGVLCENVDAGLLPILFCRRIYSG